MNGESKKSASEVERDNTIFELKHEIRHWRTIASVALAQLSAEAAEGVAMTDHAVRLPHSVYLPKTVIADINDRLDHDEFGQHMLIASQAHDFAPVRLVDGSDYFGAKHQHPCLVSPKATPTHLCPTILGGAPTLAGVSAGPEMTPIFPERPVYASAVVALRLLRLREPEAYGKLLAIVQEVSTERERIDDEGKRAEPPVPAISDPSGEPARGVEMEER